MNQSFFIRTFLRFYSELAILEPQIHVVVEQFGSPNEKPTIQPRKCGDSNMKLQQLKRQNARLKSKSRKWKRC